MHPQDGTEQLYQILEKAYKYPNCRVPVHQSPLCVLGQSQGLAGRSCDSLVGKIHHLGLKWAFIHSQKEDPLRNLLVCDLGVWETIDLCQYLESSNNLLDSFYLVLDLCSLLLDSWSLFGLLPFILGSSSFILDSQLFVLS
ncbi:hypothetical protein DSO57_1008597 [Entomophthora muscae]|uniref:Uncharacterized protein n=1 Tax=Entomophthora muscae TaxID=34485 RepID=A0ACC2S8V4_9FUNG|nr:hypothetical protein DSO57_1008597 [Entomophthora muscae]